MWPILYFTKALTIKFGTWVEHLSTILVPKDRNLNKAIVKGSNAGGGGVALGGRGHRDMGTLKAPNQPITIKSNSPPDLKL